MPNTSTVSTPEPNKAPPTGVASSIVMDMADTTWRMFIPTVGLLLLGRACDAHFGTKPWFMYAGIIIGSTAAALLIKRQLTRGGDR